MQSMFLRIKMIGKLRLNEIYTGFEGEGIFVGEIHQFIRLQGCKVGCKTCDTAYALSEKGGKLLDYDDIINKLNPSIKKVVITGGDPLLQKENLIPFLKLLIEYNYFIIIELTGLSYDEDIVKYVDFISLDLKTPSSGISLPKNQFKILSKYIVYHPNVQIKAVISDKKDFSYAVGIFSLVHDKHPYVPLIFTPCWKDKTPSDKLIDNIKDMLVKENIHYIRVIVQQHKIIYGSEKKGV